MEFSDKVGCAIFRTTLPSRFLPLNVGCSAFDNKSLHKKESIIAIPIKENKDPVLLELRAFYIF